MFKSTKKKSQALQLDLPTKQYSRWIGGESLLGSSFAAWIINPKLTQKMDMEIMRESHQKATGWGTFQGHHGTDSAPFPGWGQVPVENQESSMFVNLALKESTQIIQIVRNVMWVWE